MGLVSQHIQRDLFWFAGLCQPTLPAHSLPPRVLPWAVHKLRHLCNLVVGPCSNSVQARFLGNSAVSSMSPKPLESPRVFAVVHFPITSQLNKRGTQQGIPSLSVTQRILSRQQSRKPHCSLQSAINVGYFVPLLTQAGKRKREQKCLCTRATLFFPHFLPP